MTMILTNAKAHDDFIKGIELQNELKGVDNEPVTASRAKSLLPNIAEESNKEKIETRMTMIPPDAKADDQFIEEMKEMELKRELANVDEKPRSDLRAQSLSPQKEKEETEKASRMTMMPDSTELSGSFVEFMSDEVQKQLEEKEDDKTNEEYENKDPVVEEPCIKKHAYVTTDDDDAESQKAVEKAPESIETVPETPSRRRVARVNYSQLATGSPARTPARQGRSASIEVEPLAKIIEPKLEKLQSIEEDDVTVEITAKIVQEEIVNDEKVSEEGIKGKFCEKIYI
jgi:hypothetical protein